MYEKILAHANCVVGMDINYPDELLDSCGLEGCGSENVVDRAFDISAIEIANYHDGENVAIECTKCNEVIIDFDRPEETQTPQRRIEVSNASDSSR